MKYPLLFCALGLCIALGAGCQNGAPSGPSASSTAAPSAATSSAAQATSTATTSSRPAPSTHKPTPTSTSSSTQTKGATSYVTITDDAFEPKVLVVKAGDAVIWINKGHQNHTVTDIEGAILWDSGNLAPNATFRHVFLYPGTYQYACSIHSGMKATVVVR